MKKLVISIPLVLSLFFALAQSSYEEEQKVFNLALQFNDIQSAKSAVYKMMTIKPANQLGLIDTLSMLFYSDNDFQNCIKTTTLLLKSNPEKLSLFEMRAKSLQRLGYLKESLSDYEILYSKTNQEVFLYEILTSQYQLKRFGEAEQNANKLLKSNNDTLKVDVQIEQGKFQKVLMKSAVYNIKGVIATEITQVNVAKKMFQQALVVDPNFLLPSNNIKMLSNQQTKESLNDGDEPSFEKKKKKR